MKYLVVIEPTSTGFSSYSPDLPGCVAVGDTREECAEQMREAIEFHIESLREHNEPVPEPKSSMTLVEVAI